MTRPRRSNPMMPPGRSRQRIYRITSSKRAAGTAPHKTRSRGG
jgi:hypothetical protein